MYDTIADFTIISTKNIDLSRGAEFIRSDKRVEGEDKKYIIIIIPTGSQVLRKLQTGQLKTLQEPLLYWMVF